MENKEEMPIVSDEYIDKVLKAGPLYVTLSGAEHYTENVKTHNGEPSDESVEEMRRWSIENRQ